MWFGCDKVYYGQNDRFMSHKYFVQSICFSFWKTKVAMAQGIRMLIFPDRENTGNSLKNVWNMLYAGNIYLGSGRMFLPLSFCSSFLTGVVKWGYFTRSHCICDWSFGISSGNTPSWWWWWSGRINSTPRIKLRKFVFQFLRVFKILVFLMFFQYVEF